MLMKTHETRPAPHCRQQGALALLSAGGGWDEKMKGRPCSSASRPATCAHARTPPFYSEINWLCFKITKGVLYHCIVLLHCIFNIIKGRPCSGASRPAARAHGHSLRRQLLTKKNGEATENAPSGIAAESRSAGRRRRAPAGAPA